MPCLRDTVKSGIIALIFQRCCCGKCAFPRGPMYEFTCEVATMQPPPPEMQQLIGAIHGKQRAMDGFARMNAGTISPAEFVAPENIGALLAA